MKLRGKRVNELGASTPHGWSLRVLLSTNIAKIGRLDLELPYRFAHLGKRLGSAVRIVIDHGKDQFT